MNLYKYQEEGVKWICSELEKKSSAYLADEPGLGKTIQAIESIKRLGAYPVLVVCPASVVGVWQDEVRKWDGGNEDKWNVVTYGNAHKVKEALFTTLVIDEAHYVKNQKARRTQEVYRLSTQTKYKILLSGTPTPNCPYELWSQLWCMGRESVRNRWFWIQRYCNPRQVRYGSRTVWDLTGTNRQTVVELKEHFLRRRVQDVFTELPSVIRQDITLDLSSKDLADYSEALGSRPFHPGCVARAYQLLGIAKARACKEIIDWLLEEEDSPIVIWARHRFPLEYVTQQYNAALIWGGQDPSERTRIVAEFQEGKHKILCASILASAFGITLTRAHRCLFLEQDWVPANVLQAECRLRRIGQTRVVLARYLNVPGTLDKVITRVLRRKIESLKELNESIISEVVEELNERNGAQIGLGIE